MKVKKRHLVGKIADFPKHIVQAMCDEQVKQGNPFNPSVFAKRCSVNRTYGGFDWISTEQGEAFWENIIINENFGLLPKPEKPKGHPHAKLMKQYAKDAESHERPWELWEFETVSGGIWLDFDRSPRWDSTVKYRRKKSLKRLEK